ncbi:hypothetical protein RND71_007681 [Anisodus tanguticus]|uniref:Uncharacterized protein n=1 Tax=Anisodus tanguticus TaxID=243964 RepID=A0AAE1SM14_9SOLA|nr:hypothetical protein RND71_007681 [Anisodus tanguticus]
MYENCEFENCYALLESIKLHLKTVEWENPVTRSENNLNLQPKFPTNLQLKFTQKPSQIFFNVRQSGIVRRLDGKKKRLRESSAIIRQVETFYTLV